MYDGNPGEIDFGSSLREVRVSVGSSYRESPVYTITSLSGIEMYNMSLILYCA